MKTPTQKTLVSIALLFLSSACATSNKEKSLLVIGGGAALGAAYGASRPEEKSKNAVLYGSLVSAGAAVASLFIFDSDKESADLKAETEELRRANELLKLEVSPKLHAQGSSLLGAPVPSELRRLVKPGGWKRYKLDRWVQDDGNENIWFRQTEMFEVTPPSMGGN